MSRHRPTRSNSSDAASLDDGINSRYREPIYDALACPAPMETRNQSMSFGDGTASDHDDDDNDRLINDANPQNLKDSNPRHADD